MKRKNFTFMVFTFILLGMAFPGVLLSQIVTVGSGTQCNSVVKNRQLNHRV